MAEEAHYTAPTPTEEFNGAATDRGMFGFGKKKEETKPYEQDAAIAAEFEEKVQVSEPVQDEEKEDLLSKLHRSSSDKEEVVEGGETIKKKKGLKEKIKEKFRGVKEKPEVVDTSAPIEKYEEPVVANAEYDTNEVEAKEKMLEEFHTIIENNEKHPVGHKKTEEEVAIASSSPAPVVAEVHDATEVEAKEKMLEEFHTIIENNEKHPVGHKKTEEEVAITSSPPAPVVAEVHDTTEVKAKNEKHPVGHKKTEEEVAIASSPPAPVVAEVHDTTEVEAKEKMLEEFHTTIENNEKHPVGHKKTEEEVAITSSPPAPVVAEVHDTTEVKAKNEKHPVGHKKTEEEVAIASSPPAPVVAGEHDTTEVEAKEKMSDEFHTIIEKNEKHPIGHKKTEEEVAIASSPPAPVVAEVHDATEVEAKEKMLEEFHTITENNEKHPVGHKKTEEEVAIASSLPAPVVAEVYDTTEVDAKNKKGIFEKIKEKFPGYYPKVGEEKKEKEGGSDY